ncbi:hypothetical protein ACQKWADRAFT_206266 [Trichoderma austrokoningii]
MAARSSPRMAAIFGCDKCSEAYASPAELDNHRLTHEINYNPRRVAARASRSRSTSATVDQADCIVVATPFVAGREYFFCSTCNARFELRHCQESHSEQCRRQSSIVQPPNFHPSLAAAAALDPQYVAYMPPIPEPAAMPGDIGWVDFLRTIERREPEIPSDASEDTNVSILSGEVWQRSDDVLHVDPPDRVLGVPLESLARFFDIGAFWSQEQEQLRPAMDLISQLCDNYLAYWQKNQPVLHSPTWRFVECPPALASAMACLGSVFTRESEALQQSSHINDRCISEITRLTAGPKEFRDVGYIAALCIHQTYLIGSCHPDIHLHVDRVLSYMIQSLQEQNLLGSNLFDPGDVLLPPYMSPDTVQTEWRGWVSHEQKLRVAWMVFEYDCSLSLVTGRPCAIALGQLPKVFPCEDALYNAPDAHTWAQRVLMNSTSQGPAVSSIATLTMNKLNLPANASSWAKRLCAHIFERLLRCLLDPDQRNHAISSAREINLHLTSSLSDIQMHLLSSISYLGKSASIYNQSHAALRARNIDEYALLSTFKFARHANTLNLCTRITHAINFITMAAISSPGDTRFVELPVVQQRLLLEFASAPHHARLYVYNAGQIFRVARESTLATPVDYLRVFGAYLSILAFVKYGPSSEHVVVPGAAESYRADVFPFFHSGCDAWLQYGGPATVSECGVFYPGCPTHEIMRDAYRELCNPMGWRMKHRFYHALACFDALPVRRHESFEMAF